MKRNFMMKKLAAFTLAAALGVGLMGCQTITESSNNGESSTQAELSVTNEEENGLSMGRYVEKTIVFDDIEEYESSCIKVDDEGRINIFFYQTGKYYVSEDNGESWTSKETDWYEELTEDYVLDAAIAGDGTIAVQYWEVDANDSDDGERETHFLIVSPDGEVSKPDIKFSEDQMYARSMGFTADNRLILANFNQSVYEADLESGESSCLASLESNVPCIQSQGKQLLLATYDGLLIYDMENKSYIEDEVLARFIEDTYGGFEDYGNCFSLFPFFGEENVIYIAGEKGLHRHVIGGSVMEQVIDGSLSSFGNPSRSIVEAAALENKEFLAKFSDGSYIKFYYDETVPTVPNDKLVLYSLNDSDTARQAIAAFQTANPGVFIEYEVALEDDAVTREDALKSLNTRLMSGEGPDVLILDDMPIETYEEKGVLLDISDIIDEVKESDGLYENLLEPFYSGESIYVTPIEFQLPLIMGEGKSAELSRDYKGCVQTIKDLRTANPEGLIIRDCNEAGIIDRFVPVCAPAWKNEDGSINEEKLREFFEQTKLIYDAQMSGLSQKEISNYNDLVINKGGIGIIDKYSFYFKAIDESSYIMGKQKLSSGNAYSFENIACVFSAAGVEGREDTSVGLFDGQSEHVYLPGTMTGINAQSNNIETAKNFVRLMLSEDIQSSTFRGLPLNKKAFEAGLVKGEENEREYGSYMMYGMSDEEGNTFTWEVHWLDEEQKQLIRDWASQAAVPYIKDSIFEEAVSTECEMYLSGRRTIDEAVSNIISSTAIYMAE